MKKMILWMLAGVCMMSAVGCGAPAQPTPTSEPDQVANPVETKESAADFAELDLHIDAPEGAENVAYSVIGSEIAQVIFKLEGRIYTYRAAYSEEDISGVHLVADELAHQYEGDGAHWHASVQVKTYHGGETGALAVWTQGGVRFSLYTADAIDADTLGKFALGLAEAVFPYHAD